MIYGDFGSQSGAHDEKRLIVINSFCLQEGNFSTLPFTDFIDISVIYFAHNVIVKSMHLREEISMPILTIICVDRM